MFNRSKIVTKERRGAEIDYLRKFGSQWFEACEETTGEKLKEFTKQHPRYFDLIKIHGAVERCEVNVEQDTIKSKLIGYI